MKLPLLFLLLLFWWTSTHKKERKNKGKISSLELSFHKLLSKNTNCLPTNRDRIAANLPTNRCHDSVAYRLFIPTLQSPSPAPARWVTSNQTPSNVKLLNEWRCHESDSLLSSQYQLFPPTSYTSTSDSHISLCHCLTHIQQFTLDH